MRKRETAIEIYSERERERERASKRVRLDDLRARRLRGLLVLPRETSLLTTYWSESTLSS